MLVATVLAAGALGGSAGAAERQLTRRFGIIGEKYQEPQTRMSEAGITWSINRRMTLELSYERTGYAPLMPADHDNGIMTGVKIGF